MSLSVVLTLSRRGQSVPLARTRRRDALRVVARAALEDIRAAEVAERDEVLGALLGQERDRLTRALALLGLGEEVGRGATAS